jgi:hypothetical protein
MTRRTRTSTIVAASLLALAGCAHPGSGSATGRDSGQAGIVAIGSPSPTATATATATDTGTQDTTGNQDNGSNSGNGGGTHTSSPSPSTAPTGPRIVTFTATGAVCPVTPTPDAPYGQPGQVTLSWKIANADTVDLLMDGDPYKSYPGTEGSDTINFSCPTTGPRVKVTHTYTVIIKNTSVKKTTSASAYSNPK